MKARPISSEVKVLVAAKDFKRALDAIGADKGEKRKVWFFDTPARENFDAGVVVRAREKKDAFEVTVKLRPVDFERVPDAWRAADGVKLEVDHTGDRSMPSASFTVKYPHKVADKFEKGKAGIGDLITGEQRRFVAQLTGQRDLGWDEMVRTPPAKVKVYDVQVAGFDDEVRLERWKLADGAEVVELSMKTAMDPKEATARLTELLAGAGVKLADSQTTKTRAALDVLDE